MPNQVRLLRGARVVRNDDDCFAKMAVGGGAHLASQSTEQEIASLYLENLVIVLGGVAAEQIYDGNTDSLGDELNESDLKRARLIIRILKNRPAATQWAKKHASKSLKPVPFKYTIDANLNEVIEILKSKWTATKALATILLEKSTISGEEATKIIEVNIGKNIEETKEGKPD